MPESRFVVDPIFPVKTVNLIAGASGVGKNTLMLQIQEEWTAARLVFGYPSTPAPFCFVACDQPLATLRDQMRQLGIDPADVPHISLTACTKRDDRNLESALQFARGVRPQAKVLFIDGFASLCSGRINDAKDVTNFLIDASRFCQEENVTIIGTVPSSKAREGEGYTSPRDRIAGSVMWSAGAHTKIVIEQTHANRVSDPFRTVFLYARGLPPRTMQYQFDADGHLLYRNDGEVLPSLDAWLASRQPGDTIHSADLLEAARANGISRSALYRWLEDQTTLGTLIRLERGTYQVPPSTSPLTTIQ